MEDDIDRTVPIDSTVRADTGAEGGQPAPAIPDTQRMTKLENVYERYREAASLGSGGMGSVHAAYDPHLAREVALKTLHPQHQASDEQRLRFVREARVMARIEHPNVLPVHELGMRESDGGLYFTMKKVDGRTLKEILDGLAMGSRILEPDYPLSRLIDIFLDICQGVAYAHSRGIIHRDLKPANVVIGSFGEVIILDWGLAKIQDQPDDESAQAEMNSAIPRGLVESDEDPLSTAMNADLTMAGEVSGTPRYMSPEQVLARHAEWGPPIDQYALGVILYEILTFRPCVDGDVKEVLQAIRDADFLPPRERAPLRRIPRELDAICRRCLCLAPGDRYPDVPALIADIVAWREGRPVSVYRDPLPVRAWKWCKRHPVVSSTVSAAILAVVIVVSVLVGGSYLRVAALYDEAQGYHKLGDLAYDELALLIDEYEPLRRERIEKQPGPREAELAERIAFLEERGEADFQLALTLYSEGNPMFFQDERNDGMAALFRRRIQYAQAKGDWQQVRQYMDYIKGRVGTDFSVLPETGRAELQAVIDMLEGTATVTVKVTPADATLRLLPLHDVPGDGRVPDLAAAQQFTSDRVDLTPGNYLIEATAPNGVSITYPFTLEFAHDRGLTIDIPAEIPEGMAYIPGGPFLMGGEVSRRFQLHTRNLPGFYIRATEVTWAEYLEYWLTLPEGPQRAADMSRIQLREEDRRFQDAWDADGKLLPELSLDRPVVGITQAAAVRYCAWLSERQGRLIRLPNESEWEKAARGADGRTYVWGNEFQEDYAYTHENDAARERYGYWAPPASFPRDRSIYGVYDMAGNVREWTGNLFPNSHQAIIRGGSASLGSRFAATPYASDTPVVPTDVGFRYVVPIE